MKPNNFTQNTKRAMKHFSFFIFLFSFAFAFASCSKSDDVPTPSQNDNTTTFTLAVDGVTTRGTTAVTPARYIMEVWSEDGLTAENVFGTGDAATNRTEVASGSITVALDKTKAYTCLFWADDNAAFNAASLKAIAVNADKSATEAYFSKVAVAKGKNPAVAVTLKRAVAKITLTETSAVKTDDNLVLKLTNINPTFSVLDGTATGTAAEWTKTVKPSATTGVIGTFYLFAKAEKVLSDLTFTYAAEVEKTVSNIPVQQNHATNIKGEFSNLFAGTFTITADDAWTTPDNDVELDREPSMSFTIDLTAYPTDKSYILPFEASTTRDYTLTVKWGDGQTETIAPTASVAAGINHNYADAKTYQITITSSQKDPTKAQVPDFRPGANNNTTNNNAEKLKSMDTPMLCIGTSFAFAFDGCTGLSGIPANLFVNNTAATSFEECFNVCTGLSGEIPAGLFANNTLATSFERCFFNCYGLSGTIPESLFANNTAVTNFSLCFTGCKGLSSIPANLFANNTAVTNFSNCFSSCEGLSSISAGLFANNTLATDFSSCFGGCRMLVLNADIFCVESEETKATRFAGKTMNFSSCFYNVGVDLSDGNGGTAPALWNYTMAASAKGGCFYNVTKVTNAADIDWYWKQQY